MRREDIETLLKAVKVNILTTRQQIKEYQANPSLYKLTESELNEAIKRNYKMRNWLMIQLAQTEK